MDSLILLQHPKWKCKCDGKEKNDWIIEIFEDKAQIQCNWCGTIVAITEVFISKKAIFHRKIDTKNVNETCWNNIKYGISDILVDLTSSIDEGRVFENVIKIFEDHISKDDIILNLQRIMKKYKDEIK